MYVIKKNGKKVDQVEDLSGACRVAEAFEEFYPDSVIEIEESK
jgi:hypothetical protein